MHTEEDSIIQQKGIRVNVGWGCGHQVPAVPAYYTLVLLMEIDGNVP